MANIMKLGGGGGSIFVTAVHNTDGTQNILITDKKPDGSIIDVPAGATLLWENANPASIFVAQTVTVEGDDYDAYLVEVRGYYTDDGTAHGVTFVPKDGAVRALSSIKVDSLSVAARKVTATGNDLEFTTGYTLTIGSGGAMNASQNTGSAVPTRIWGVNFTLDGETSLATPTIYLDTQ